MVREDLFFEKAMFKRNWKGQEEAKMNGKKGTT